MCYSPEASFALGGALFPVGAYCLRSAWVKDRRLLTLAVVPVLLGIQQIGEGFVWLALNAGDLERARLPSLVFLFFALALWPFWFSLVGAISETRPTNRRWLVVLAFLTSAWFWVLFYPLLAEPSRLTPMVVHHSIRYEMALPIEAYLSRLLIRVLYLLSIVVPLAIGPRFFSVLPGFVLAGSAVVAAVAYEYAFASVWCFFAAISGLALCGIFYYLPARNTPTSGPAGPFPSESLRPA